MTAAFSRRDQANTISSKEERDYDQPGMRFSDAYGYGKDSKHAWYSTSAPDLDALSGKASTDVWGNEDPGRKEREKRRMNTEDPLAAIKKGVKALKQAEVERSNWKAQRESDLVEVEQLAALEQADGRDSRKRRRRSSDAGSLENFSLNDAGQNLQGTDQTPRSPHRHRHHRHHRHHHRRREHGKHDRPEGSRDERRSHKSRRDKDK